MTRKVLLHWRGQCVSLARAFILKLKVNSELTYYDTNAKFNNEIIERKYILKVRETALYKVFKNKMAQYEKKFYDESIKSEVKNIKEEIILQYT